MKKRKYLIAIALISLGITVSFYFILNREDTYGRAYDKERIERGIPIIGEQAYTSDDWGYSWMFPVKEKGHRYKLLTIKNGELAAELDGYEAGIKYTTEDNRQAEEYIQIIYSYEDERAGSNPWSAIYYFREGQRNITLAEAEEILTSWGISRL